MIQPDTNPALGPRIEALYVKKEPALGSLRESWATLLAASSAPMNESRTTNGVAKPANEMAATRPSAIDAAGPMNAAVNAITRPGPIESF